MRHSRRRTRFALNITACALLPLGSAAQIFTAPDENAARYPVHGVVLDSLSHQPIPRVLVENNNAAALTDGEGRFELNLPGETLQISVRRPGYNPRGQEQNHTVHVGPNTPKLTFFLTPEATITGHVTLSTGESADGITFIAFRKTLIEGRERWEAGSSAATGSEGTFRMANLAAPAQWIVCSVPTQDRVGARLAGGAAPPATVGFPSTCYPGPIPSSGDVAPANALALAPGQQAEIEIDLTRQPFYRVAIAIANAAGAAGIGIEIHDPSGQTLEFSTEWNAKKGLAETYLPSGQYYAIAHAEGSGANYGRIDFRVGGAPLTGLHLMLIPLHPIPVEVHREFSAASEPADRFANGLGRSTDDAGLNITLLAADSQAGEMGGGGLGKAPGSSDPSLFELEGVVPGRYWVQTYPFEGYVSSITSGASDLSRQPLIVGAGNSATPIEVTLRNNTGQIRCSVAGTGAAAQPDHDGEIGYVFLYAIPAAQTGSQIPQATGQQAQPVTIANLAPGTYRVVAYDQYQQIDLGNAQQLAEIAAKGQTVTVSPGATASVQLELIHATSASPDEETDSPE